MKFFFEFLPILLFFIAYKTYDIFIATAVAIIASIGQVLFLWIKDKKVENGPLITMVLLIVMGGATIYFHDEAFIKWKVSVINWLFGGVFIASSWIGKENMCQKLMGKSIELPKEVWHKLNLTWGLFFMFSGFLNIFIAFTYDLDTWVNFKLFGLMGLTIIFIIGQAIFLRKYIKE
ncbi:Intracellular septation protein IspA [hydrothermal vent metagenome]|uniref:Intracellular septation protein IspA n=1 Tax=hydrothermal vent metagenome TaxID=652676 RepID=A0A1W1CJM3_9ZZZZ